VIPQQKSLFIFRENLVLFLPYEGQIRRHTA